jgi:hypothetical protein
VGIRPARGSFGVAMLALLAASLLACPPTTISTHDQRPASWPVPASLEAEPARPPTDPPELPGLPLWDLAATATQLDELWKVEKSEEVAWLRWVVAEAQAKPLSSHRSLVDALSSSTLRAERMLWWLAHQGEGPDARDALDDAYARTESSRTRHLLALALVLNHVEASCSVDQGPDRACRMPGSSLAVEHDVLIRRDGVALERANDWERKAAKLAKKAKIEPDDLALQALLAEVEFASSVEDYESVLVARQPEELSFELEEWKHDSGIATWERTYARQVEVAHESRRRLGAFQTSQFGCIEAQFDDQARVERTSTSAAMLASLRRAKLMFAAAETHEELTRIERDEARLWDESREWRRHPSTNWQTVEARERAVEQAEQCVALGTTIGGSAKILEACFDVLETHDPRRVPQAELVPEPGALTTMQAVGVVPLQPSVQQRNPVE